MKRIKIMHVVPDLVPYGLERMVATLARRSDRRRFDVSVVSLYDETPGSLGAELSLDSIRVFHLGKRRGPDPRMWWRLSQVVRSVKPDIVHSHNYVLRYVLPGALWLKVPRLVHTIHNTADREVEWLGKCIQAWAFRHRVQPVVISEEGAASYERVYRLPAAPMIRNGITVERYAVPTISRAAWRAQQGFHDDDLLFACVARLDRQKNHETLIQAFAWAAAQEPRARLLLAGDGGLRPQCEEQARSLGIADRVHFLGRRGDIPELLASCDAFVLASLWEGNPLAVMEALSAGVPVIGTAVGAVPELCEDGVHGMIVPPGDETRLCEAMLAVVRDPVFRRRAGAAAAAMARQRFGHQQMVEAYETLYQLLLEDRRFETHAERRGVSA